MSNILALKNNHGFSAFEALDAKSLPDESPENWLLMLDVDGTLLDIAHRPDAVSVPLQLKETLLRLHTMLNGALLLVSGRSIQELDRLFNPLRLSCVGLHGGEYRIHGKVQRLSTDALIEQNRLIAQACRDFAKSYPDLQVEAKTLSTAIHYRRNPAREQEVRTFVQQWQQKMGTEWQVLFGKMVAELKPVRFSKASTIQTLMTMELFQSRKPVYVGDDITDEKALLAVHKKGGHAVRVGNILPGEQMWYAENPQHVRQWLDQLATQINPQTLQQPLRQFAYENHPRQELRQRIVVVSNRVSLPRASKANTGGLAVAMSAVLGQHGGVWAGWSGKIGTEIQNQTHGKTTYLLRDLTQEEHDQFYTCFCNGTLWPLLHHNVGLSDFSHQAFEAYLQVSQRFADMIATEIQPSDLIWVHDFHFIPLAHMLRARGITNRIGFFLHTPFPSKDVLLTLPVHKELMSMLYSYDVVGFQTQNDLATFHNYSLSESVKLAARYPAQPESMVGHFPIGIHTRRFAELSRKSLDVRQTVDLQKSLLGRKLILGVDRLDYSKGILQRMKGIEELLERNEALRKTFTMLQIAPPTREDVDAYAKLRSEVESLIGHINGKHTEVDWVPIRFLVRGIGREILASFYRIANVCLVTPLRDGMNLVAKEYIAAQNPDNPGVLVLSRFAGAAEELSQALLVNPYDVHDVSQAIERALSMPLEERQERWRALYRTIAHHNLEKWYQDYLDALVG